MSVKTVCDKCGITKDIVPKSSKGYEATYIFTGDIVLGNDMYDAEITLKITDKLDFCGDCIAEIVRSFFPVKETEIMEEEQRQHEAEDDIRLWTLRTKGCE